MFTGNHDHINFRRVLLVALVALVAGFGFGVYGAYALEQYVPRAEAQGVTSAVVAKKVTLPIPTMKTASVKKLPSPPKAPVVKAKNMLVVPQMGVNSAILEGKSAKTLNSGLWHIPGTSNPAKGGNTVISAHRYMWRPPSTKTFWDIDKMKVGDQITITWAGKVYTYAVAKTSIVKPNRVDILANTKIAKLTLFTCTPKFTSKNRFVIEAYPIGQVYDATTQTK